MRKRLWKIPQHAPGGGIIFLRQQPNVVAKPNQPPEQRRRLSPTQTPYFRVMVKGERVTPRPERADDVSWPRPEPPPVADALPPAEGVPDKKLPAAKAKKADAGTGAKPRKAE